MVASFGQQFRTTFRKNISIHIRSRSFLKELVNVAIIIGVVIILSKTGN
jgi:hypothetical protein